VANPGESLSKRDVFVARLLGKQPLESNLWINAKPDDPEAIVENVPSWSSENMAASPCQILNSTYVYILTRDNNF
jgi:hypothetical protein